MLTLLAGSGYLAILLGAMHLLIKKIKLVWLNRLTSVMLPSDASQCCHKDYYIARVHDEIVHLVPAMLVRK